MCLTKPSIHAYCHRDTKQNTERNLLFGMEDEIFKFDLENEFP